jgi:hypothetical protein
MRWVQYPERFPAHLAPLAGVLPGKGRSIRDSVCRCKNTERSGFGNWFAQKVNQGFANAVVGDAARREKKFHDGFLSNP